MLKVSWHLEGNAFPALPFLNTFNQRLSNTLTGLDGSKRPNVSLSNNTDPNKISVAWNLKVASNATHHCTSARKIRCRRTMRWGTGVERTRNGKMQNEPSSNIHFVMNLRSRTGRNHGHSLTVTSIVFNHRASSWRRTTFLLSTSGFRPRRRNPKRGWNKSAKVLKCFN